MKDVENNQRKGVTFGISLALISSLIFAFVPNFAKIALDSGASLYFLVISRYAIGALILVFVMRVRRKKFRRLSSKQILRICISGFSACALISLTYHAVEYLDVGVVMIVLYCFPIGVAVVLHIQEKQQLRKKQWLLMALAVLGLSVMLADKNFDLNIYGLAISFLGLIFFIAFIITAADLSNEIGAISFNFYISLIGIILLSIVYISPLEITVSISKNLIGHLSIIGNGIFYILSWVIFFESSRILGATRSSVIACSEPLFAALLAIPLLGQKLSVIEWFGFFVVLVSLYMFEKKSAN